VQVEEEKKQCLPEQSSSILSLLCVNKLLLISTNKYAIPMDWYGIEAHSLHCINGSPLTYTREGLPVAML